jgi:stage V sporulation protein S
MEVLKITAKSNPNSVAGALAGVLKENGSAKMQAIGAGAINQAVKAIAIARGFVAPIGMDLIFIPAFNIVQIGGEERTAILFIVEPRRRSAPSADGHPEIRTGRSDRQAGYSASETEMKKPWWGTGMGHSDKA